MSRAVELALEYAEALRMADGVLHKLLEKLSSDSAERTELALLEHTSEAFARITAAEATMKLLVDNVGVEVGLRHGQKRMIAAIDLGGAAAQADCPCPGCEGQRRAAVDLAGQIIETAARQP